MEPGVGSSILPVAWERGPRPPVGLEVCPCPPPPSKKGCGVGAELPVSQHRGWGRGEEEPRYLGKKKTK